MTDRFFDNAGTTRPPTPTILAWTLCLAVASLNIPGIAMADDPQKSVAEWVRDGNRLLEAGQFDKALEAYDRAQALHPESAKVAYNRGIALYKLGRFDEAETALQNALTPDARTLEADVKYNLGRTAQGAAMASKGDLQAALDQTKRAVGFYKDALQLRPNDADTRKNLGIAENQKQFLEKLIELAKQQQEQSQQNPDDQQNQDQNDSDSSAENEGGEGQKSDSKNGESEQDQNQQEQNQGSNSDSNNKEQSENKSGESESESKSDSEGQQGDKEQQNSKEADGQQDESKRDNTGNQGAQDQRSDEQIGEDQLKEAQARKAQAAEQMKNEQKPGEEGESGDEEALAQRMAQATTQSATSMPAETPLEMAQRISIDKANRLLQEARDKEAERRESLREARLSRLGRSNVEKDW